ncbi:endolytic transglycosylase MltG [Trueperella pyogenes]|uniref:Endolytic murein transglycosylase n=1 Tax=Trueperella pyogenes TaxID=1661 RepID=A0A380M961_9ACTO|nr:endolytic transglycosylase MltG [Trueperella pyogenes]AJC69637.1 aminodeoxychorismate lyase [Trueperella pyogenes TP8]AWG04680.1 endolytic transglycosylase MltG [Trueperella pyogenes]AWG15506.1 endolytic transglycosylase MltG [Trueperella pyogenes]AZR04393.1 endolytic transglycosylase MltG [Trueperella pyogenes]AZR06038.1 endolytic transglycosylase MltG [Trueperella pyogenes]
MSELFNDLPQSTQRHTPSTAARKSRRRKRSLRTAIVTFVAVALLVMSVVVALPHVKTLLSIGTSTAEDYTGEGTGEVIVTIPEGSTGRDIASILVANGVVASERAFVDAFSADKRAASIQAGSYRLKQKMSAVSAVASLLDRNSRAEITVTIPEGFTVKQVSDRLVNVLGYDAAEVETAFADAEAISLPAEAGGNAEGWLSPVTYTFAPNTTAKEAVAAMVKQRIGELQNAGIPREKWQRTIILASIVEREVNWPDYYGQVARVIENRLADQGQVNGRLQMDSTVLYGVGKSGGVPTREDLAADNPYNTYLKPGLPPTPISNPSIKVITATVNPPAGDWLYFVTVNLKTGETKFANNLTDHNANVEQLRKWVAENPHPTSTGENNK